MSTSVSRRSSAPVHPTRQQLEELDALLKRMLDLPVNALGDEAESEEASPAAAPTGTETAVAASPPEMMRGPHHPAFVRPTEAAPPNAVNYQTPDAEEADLKPRLVPAAPDAGRKETAAAAPPPPERTAEKPQSGGDWVPLTSSWRPSARTWKPLSEAWRQAQTGIDGPLVEPPWTRKETPPPAPETAAPPAPETPPRLEAPQPAVEADAPAAPEEAPQRVALSAVRLGARRRWKPALPAQVQETPWFLWPLVGFNAAFDAGLLPWGPLGRWLRGPTGRSFLGILGLLCLTAAAAWAAAEWIGWTR